MSDLSEAIQEEVSEAITEDKSLAEKLGITNFD